MHNRNNLPNEVYDLKTAVFFHCTTSLSLSTLVKFLELVHSKTRLLLSRAIKFCETTKFVSDELTNTCKTIVL